MRFSTLLRHLREGALSLARNGWMSFASVSSIAISLFILGVFLLLSLISALQLYYFRNRYDMQP